MKNKTILAFILLFMISGLLPLQGQEVFTVTEDIHIAEGEVRKNVISFGGKVVIEGEVREMVLVFGGEVIIINGIGTRRIENGGIRR